MNTDGLIHNYNTLIFLESVNGNEAKNWTHKTVFLIVVEIPKDNNPVTQNKPSLVKPSDETGKVKANLQVY